MAWFNWGKSKDKKKEKEQIIQEQEEFQADVEQESEWGQQESELDKEDQPEYELEQDMTEPEQVSPSQSELETFNAGSEESESEISEDEAVEEELPKQKKPNLFDRLKSGLKKTRDSITDKIDQVLVSFGKVDEDLFEELEEALITSDMGMETSLSIISELREKVKKEKITSTSGVKQAIMDIIASKLEDEDSGLKLNTKPSVIVIIGVNGVGKTTSIGKIAYYLKEQGKKVTVAAADTFRAAAIDQLEIWAKRAGVGIIKHTEGADPSAVIYDAVQHCKSKGIDVLICDTAGRLHTKKNLMEELKKIFRVIQRELPDADIETLLVLDATTGQNAVSQAKTFSEVSQLTGLVLTKLDGTAKGGIIVSIKSELNVPVKFIGVGEQMYDLQPFNPHLFVKALFDN
ncbi:MAG: signal recognition particle-docking protein FtsY [Clostridiaceae bacterium]|nr:signal recognition particle-docking protein FtsY [Clostridiaceae bacterium]